MKEALGKNNNCNKTVKKRRERRDATAEKKTELMMGGGGGFRRGKAKCNETGFHIVCSTVLWPWRKRNGGDTQNRTRNFYTGQQTV